MLTRDNDKDLYCDWLIHRHRALSKCYFEESVGEAKQQNFLWCLLAYEALFSAVQMDIGLVWDTNYHYHLYLTDIIPIWAKLHACSPERNTG